ncbi:MAG: inorganic diphosphatase [Coprobacillaceae bacterium]
MIGSIVTVQVDRELGTYHPKYKELYYPINYGYIDGVIGGDGEEQDAYILGVNEPVSSFKGEVIAIVHRNDENEENWVVAAIGSKYTKEKIKELVHFQEQYFDSYIIM